MNQFLSKWRITQMDAWAQDMVDLYEEGHFNFDTDDQGRFIFYAVEGHMDVVVNTRMPEL